MKYCPRCGEEKPATIEFWYRNSQSIDGLHTYCKICKSNIHKEYMKDSEVKKRVLRKIKEWQKGVGKEKWKVIRKRSDTSPKRVAWRRERTKKAIEVARDFIKSYSLM